MPYEVIGFTGSPSAGAYGTLNAVTGDLATIKYFSQGYAQLLNLWGQQAPSGVAGQLEVYASDWHDTSTGINPVFQPLTGVSGVGTGSTGIAASQTTDFLLGTELYQPLNSQSVLTVKGSGSSTNIGAGLMNFYSYIDGINQKLISPDMLRGHIINRKTIAVQLNAGTTYVVTSTALNNSDTSLHGNTYYAIEGFCQVGEDSLLTGIRGNITGNLHVGYPGLSFYPQLTRDCFVKMSRLFGRPMIPYFNSADQANIFVEAVTASTTAIAPKVSLNLLETDLTS
jgi:hypothetical protein